MLAPAHQHNFAQRNPIYHTPPLSRTILMLWMRPKGANAALKSSVYEGTQRVDRGLLIDEASRGGTRDNPALSPYLDILAAHYEAAAVRCRCGLHLSAVHTRCNAALPPYPITGAVWHSACIPEKFSCCPVETYLVAVAQFFFSAVFESRSVDSLLSYVKIVRNG